MNESVTLPESKIVNRSAPVNRTRTQMEAFKATGRVPHVSVDVAVAMPLCVGDHVEIDFINLGYSVACDKLDEELDKLGVELIVDPQGLAAINEADKVFADTHPNGTQWKDANDNYCCAFFRRWGSGHDVVVCQDDGDWNDHWWFPVRHK